MVILICILFIIWCIDGICSDSDRKAERHNDNLRAERRHRELIEATKKRRSNKRFTRRRVVKNKDLTLGEEIIEEYEDE